ncbi:MAG TPA: PAS domain S-box protein, partial [Thermosynechococcaceae cyanobacterium]
VQGELGVRFYAGAPLLSRDGFNLGTLCLLVGQPRNSFSAEQQATLVDLAAIVVDELELRLAAYKIAQVDAALLEVTQGVATVTGETYFDALVQHFAKVLDADYVYIGLVEGDDSTKILRTIATCEIGQIIENLEYPLQETPCWEALQQRKICCYPRNVQAQFPNASLLKPLSVESYVAIPFFDSSGTILGLLGVMDGKPLENVQLAESLMTIFALRIATELERQQTEAALYESEAKYRTLFESLDEGFCICEMQFDENGTPIDYQFLEVNPAFEAMTGLEQATGKTVRELVPNLEADWFEIYGRVVRTGEPVRFENQSSAMNRWFNVNAFCIGEPQSNQFALLFTDISERKKAEQERDRFLAVGSNLQVIDGSNGYFQWVSPTFERLLGWTADEMTSHPWTDFVHPDDINPSVTETVSLFSGRKTFEFENRYRHKDGSYRWFLWNVQPYPEEQVIYGSAIDITERKCTEQNAELLANVSQSLVEAINVDEIVQIVGEQLHRFLKTSICAFVEINEKKNEAAIHYDWHQDDVPSIVGVYSLPEFVTAEFLQAAKAGQPIVVRDVTRDPRIVDPQRYAPLKINAEINIPLIRDGEWKFSLAVFYQTPYNWRTDEIELMRELASRIWNRLERTSAEAALRESEVRFRQMADTAPVLIWMSGTDKLCYYFNQLWLDFTGRMIEQERGNGWAEGVHPDDFQRCLETYITAFDARQSFQIEYRLRRFDGVYRWLLDSGVPRFTAEGDFLGYIGSCVDIDARKQAEAALQESEEQSRNILESITDAFFAVDENWRFTYVNQTAETLIDRTVSDLIGKVFWEEFPGVNDSAFEQMHRRVMRDRVAESLTEFYPDHARWYEVRSYPAVNGITMYFRNVTDQIQAEEALRESEERFRTLADQMSQFAWMADANGWIFWYNRRWFDYTGTTLEEMQGWRWQQVHHPEHVARVVEHFRHCLEIGEQWEDIFPLRSKDGNYRWFLSRAIPVRDAAGNILRWFGTNTDITERLQAEQEREQLLEREQAARSDAE